MSCHGFLVASAGPRGSGGTGGHRPSIPVALIAQRALHAVANAQPVALSLHTPPPPPPLPPLSMPPPLLPPPAASQGHFVMQCPNPRVGSPPHSGRAGAVVPKCRDGGGGDPAQVGSAEILRRQHLAQQRQRTQLQKGGKAVAEVPSGRTVLGMPVEVVNMILPLSLLPPICLPHPRIRKGRLS